MSRKNSRRHSKPFRQVQNRSARHSELKGWDTDSFKLNIWVQVKEGGRWVARQVWIAVMFDSGSGAIVGFILRTWAPTAQDLSEFLRFCLEHAKGRRGFVCDRPKVIRTDPGKEFMSSEFQEAVDDGDLDHAPADWAAPQPRRRAERWIRSLESKCLRPMPGYKSLDLSAERPAYLLLTLEELQREITRWNHDC